MFCTRTLFDGRNSDGIFDDRVHLAELVALLGPPPEEFRKRMELNSVFWDESGRSILQLLLHCGHLLLTLYVLLRFLERTGSTSRYNPGEISRKHRRRRQRRVSTLALLSFTMGPEGSSNSPGAPP